MTSFPRWAVAAPLAIGVTGGLFFAMTRLIATEFAPVETSGNAVFELSPVVQDIEILDRDIDIPEPEVVQLPPAPPVIDTVKAGKPTVPIKEPGGLPDLPVPDPIITSVKFIPGDRNIQPLLRIPPQMPPAAERSGHCDVRMDVGPDGRTFNVRTTGCSDRIFERATIRSVAKWRYQPMIRDGVAVTREGVTNTVRFNLLDERGNLIPER